MKNLLAAVTVLAVSSAQAGVIFVNASRRRRGTFSPR